ncbi:dipeptidyl aminopeptidase/acylaminoacyl peptidase [Paucibacter oligotrophus]|uniref:Dipeptidyl aminopeptidase/acylaminoacyl peptidase n=1 Tax=Roseateles oligotrophus TaxID=1769250 RepID=A0A840LIL1_9BURK|nr:prolyl oligopeptidase family serine peptidase [Roseateles oligotrophus]MBB4845819.1 dipeptidyl aminopeptidase/acylaminoacyl peptidase [Roseateles oligotrophus]
MSEPIKRANSFRYASLSLVLSLACAGLAQADEARPALVQPNANLLVQGIPAIPQSLAEDVARYTDFRGHGFVDWHPKQREMLVSHRQAGANTAQLFSVGAPRNGKPGELQALTDAPDPVSRAAYEPKTGKYLVFERANGGDEVAQLYRLDLGPRADKTPVLLTPPQERHALVSWLNAGGELIYASTPLDRTAQGGSRAEVTTTFWQLDPLSAEPLKSRRKLVELPGGGWFAGQLSRDDKQLALTRYLSANESEIWLLNLGSGALRQVLPAKTQAQANASVKTSYFGAGFSRDGKHLWFSGDQFGEFRELQRLNLATGELQRVSAHIPWDASGVNFSPDGRRLVAQFNVEGRNELHLFDSASAKELPLPKLPQGNVGGAHFDDKRGELAFSVNNAHGPSQIYSLSGKGQLQAWTQAYAPPGVDTRTFPEQQIIRWKSFDGQAISGLMTLPPAQKFPGKRPVLISIHGGPESQASVGFLNRNSYFVMEQGIALIQPNVRGSSGFGKSFLAMDNGFKREDSVKDIGALLDWIATQPNLDASRVLIMGGSYGGYMTLATATHYAERIAGSIDVVGISHFLTFLKNTESYRRDLRRVEYGDERDPAMREHLEKISPLTNAHLIKKPLFVVQGKNDPRVPYTEAEQIVAKVRENGTPVWYLRADNEGHGFARKENQDFQFYATILFLRETLLK